MSKDCLKVFEFAFHEGVDSEGGLPERIYGLADTISLCERVRLMDFFKEVEREGLGAAKIVVVMVDLEPKELVDFVLAVSLLGVFTLFFHFKFHSAEIDS